MDLTNSSEPKKEIFDVAGATRSSTSTISSTSKRKRRNKQRDHRPTSHPDDRSSALEKRLNGKPAHDPLGESVAKETKPLSGRPGYGARGRIDEGPEQAEARLAKMCAAVRTLIECVGEDPDREGLLTTPSRYAKALLFLTKGYQINVDDILNNALFHEGYSEMVIVKDIDIYSLCEHHLVPFIGKVGFVPTRVSFLAWS
jgi:GTP cyclohydrolase I